MAALASQKNTSGPGGSRATDDLICIATGSSSHTAKTMHNGGYLKSSVDSAW